MASNEPQRIGIFVLKFNPTPAESAFTTTFSFLNENEVGETPKCEKCGAFIGGLESLPPFHVELEILGKGWGDLAFGPGRALLVSKRFKESFEEKALNGLSQFESVEIVSASGKNRNNGKTEFFHPKILRSNVRINHLQSGMEEPPTCNHCLSSGLFKRIKKVVIQPDSWHGEDIFFPLGLPGTILTSEKFREFCHQNSFTNVVLVPGENYRLDFYSWETKA